MNTSLIGQLIQAGIVFDDCGSTGPTGEMIVMLLRREIGDFALLLIPDGSTNAGACSVWENYTPSKKVNFICSQPATPLNVVDCERKFISSFIYLHLNF